MRPAGFKHTAATKAKMSKAKTGKPRDPDTRARIAASVTKAWAEVRAAKAATQVEEAHADAQ